MGKQAKLKKARKLARFQRAFLADVNAAVKDNPELKKLFQEIIDLKKINAPDDVIHVATKNFSKEFLRIKGIGGNQDENNTSI